MTLRVVGAAVIEQGRLLLVSKRAAPAVFFLPGGKPEAGEEPLETLERELDEELGVSLVSAEPFGTISAQSALEHLPMEMTVFLTQITGPVEARAEIASIAWIDARGDRPGTLAPAVRDHLIPQLVGAGLLT